MRQGAKLPNLPARVRTLDLRTVRPPPKRADCFYSSPEWRALMSCIIAQRGRRCEDPEHDPVRPRTGIRVFGDHVHELRDGGAPLDPRNILLRCGSCHSRKTAAAARRRKA